MVKKNHGGARKGAGRKKGTRDEITSALREKIDAESIITFLNDVANGRQINDDKPTIEHRLKASDLLMRKTLPDLKAVEVSGELNVHESLLDDLE